MFKHFTLSLTLTALIASPLALAEESTPATAEEATPVAAKESAPVADEKQLNIYRTAIKKLGGRLKPELQKAMKAGGPIAALEICHDKAPQIASEVSESSGFSVSRTSLKPRNSSNAPESWQTEVLEQFEADKAAGKAVEKLEYYKIVDKEDGGRQARYMKAIPTAPVCLKCHGAEIPKEISTEIATKLNELYPEDKARGFKVGDLRGAFSIIHDIPSK